jgi:hypothetical protein
MTFVFVTPLNGENASAEWPRTQRLVNKPFVQCSQAGQPFAATTKIPIPNRPKPT